MKITIPITADSMNDALTDMDKAALVADIIELRIDYMKEKPNLERLLHRNSLPKIVTNRHKDEGGNFQGSEVERIAYLQQAINLGVEYIDIEQRHYHILDKKNSKIIVSYHDFEKTPKNLKEIYNEIANLNPNIVKIAAKANNHNDSLRMLDLIKKADQDIIGICMGEKGVITRVYGPALGSYLTFASLESGKSSAPGQISVDELKQAWKLLQLE